MKVVSVHPATMQGREDNVLCFTYEVSVFELTLQGCIYGVSEETDRRG